MNGDPGDPTTTPVRRSARTRKPNSRFADDEVDGCFKKIVSGLGSPEATPPLASPAPGRPKKVGRRKDSQSDDQEDHKIKSVSGARGEESPASEGLPNGLEAGLAESGLRSPCEEGRRTRSGRREEVEPHPPKDPKKRNRKRGRGRKSDGEEEEEESVVKEGGEGGCSVAKNTTSMNDTSAQNSALRTGGKSESVNQEESELVDQKGETVNQEGGKVVSEGKSGLVNQGGEAVNQRGEATMRTRKDRRTRSTVSSAQEGNGDVGAAEMMCKDRDGSERGTHSTPANQDHSSPQAADTNLGEEGGCDGDVRPRECMETNLINGDADNIGQLCSTTVEGAGPTVSITAPEEGLKTTDPSFPTSPSKDSKKEAMPGKQASKTPEKPLNSPTEAASSTSHQKVALSCGSIPLPPEVPRTIPQSPKVPRSIPLPPEAPKTPSPTKVPQSISTPPKVPQGLPIPPKVPQGLPTPPKVPQGLPTPPKVPQGLPMPPKVPQGLPTPPKVPQGLPTPPKVPQDLPTPPKVSQDIPTPPKVPQDLPTPPKVPQDLPTPPKVNQNLPTPPKVLQNPPETPQCVPLPPEVPKSPADLKQQAEGGRKAGGKRERAIAGVGSGAPDRLAGELLTSPRPKRRRESQQQGKEEEEEEEEEETKRKRHIDTREEEKRKKRRVEEEREKPPSMHVPNPDPREEPPQVSFSLADIPIPAALGPSPTQVKCATGAASVTPPGKEDRGVRSSRSPVFDNADVFLPVSRPISTTSIPFLGEGDTSPCRIPGLSIVAPETPPRPQEANPGTEEQSKNWFTSEPKREGAGRGDGGEGDERTTETDDKENLKPQGAEGEDKGKAEVKEEVLEEGQSPCPTSPKQEEKDCKLTEEEAEELKKKKQREAEEKEARNMEVVEQRLKSFVHLQENVYIGERRRSKRNKEVRRMVCDCSLTKEELARGEVGCGDDCLNRLLMIECGSRCPLRDRCINRRFLNREYGDVEVFNADEKGCGLRARTPMPPGTFIMEYVGEVFDTREFKRRRKEYARDHSAHFYFMALKSDQLIDATRKGNISRFINHSCDPNAETQKWTVNGDLRIGFFSKKYIEAGEEINFDYRLERYGREPQKCYCGTQVCRGWLGESPDEQTKEEKDEARRKEERDRRKREERRAFFEDIDLEDEIEKLNSHKLRNRQDTLNLSRLMVRAEDFNSRVMLLQLLQTGEPACRRLFLDYHGLKVLWSWMADLGLSRQHTALKIEILKTLECLPITNKTQLTDSRVLSLVERWSLQPDAVSNRTLSPPPPPPPKMEEASLSQTTPALVMESDPNKKSSDTSEESDSETDPKMLPNSIEGSSADDSSMDSEADQVKPMVEEESSDSNDAKDANASSSNTTSAATSTSGDGKALEEEVARGEERLLDEEREAQELLEAHRSMLALALKLLDAWKSLKEFFRIPKKERIELMKEHEREVDRGYKEYLDSAQEGDRDSERDRDRRDKERDRYNRREHYYDRRRRSPDRDNNKERYQRGRGSREDRSSDSPKMSKEQRRQLFELKVQQQEEEAKQRKMQEEMWTMHVDRCRLLGHDPYLTPIFDPTYQYYWDPVAANWQPYTGSADPNIPVPASYGLNKGEGDGSPLTLLVPGAPQACLGHLQATGDPSGLGQGGPDDPLNPANIPLPGEVPALPQTSPSQPQPGQAIPVEGTPPQGAKVLSIPLPGEVPPANTVLSLALDSSNTVLGGEGEEGPQAPGPITIQLPPRWRLARDTAGHVYFYHVKTRSSQWEPPTMEQHHQLEAQLGSDSSSDSSSDSDSDSTSTSDSEDFSSEDEEEEEVETVARSEVSDEKMIRRPRSTKRRRSEALVQERVISPIMEVDREAARRERREAKERAREEARQERQEERITRSQKDQQQQQQQQQWQEGMDGVTAAAPAAPAIASVLLGATGGERERDRERERASRAERHEGRVKREKVKSKERAATAIADNSDTARKIKDTFRSKMATFIVSVLNPYRKGDCKEGKITCTEDFKYLARKLTHFVMVKELKQLHSIDALECSDSVKHKTRDFVRKYMSKYGSVFKRDPNDTKEY